MSNDIFYLVDTLHRQARAEAASLDGNASSYVWAALPMLLSGLSATIVEQEALFWHQRKPDRVQVLIDERYLPKQLERLYGLNGGELADLKILVELRNEIIHPAPTPTGTPDNWPDTLRAFKQRGFLSSTGDPQNDYLTLEQMKSLRLLEWAMGVVERLRALVLKYHEHSAS